MAELTKTTLNQAPKEINSLSWIINDPNLKLYYRFEDASGTTVADSSTAANTGEASRTAVLGQSAGKFGNGATFVSASSDYVNTPDNATLHPVKPFTIGAWIKTSSSGVAQGICQWYSANTNIAGIRMFVGADGKFYITLGNNTGTVAGTNYIQWSSPTLVNDGFWHFCVMSWDGTKAYMYVDANLEFSGNCGINPAYAAATFNHIGCLSDSGAKANFFNGMIDEVFLLNGTALGAEQVRSIYGSGLRAYYKFEGSDFLTDSSGWGNTLTNNNSVAQADGKFGQCADMGTGNTNKYLGTATDIGIPGDHSMSISFWVKINAQPTSGAYMLASHLSSTGQKLMRIYYEYQVAGNQLVLEVAGAWVWNPTGYLANGTWNHIVATRDNPGTWAKLYINGVLVKTGPTGTATTAGNVFRLGTGYDGTGYTNAAIDDVAIFDRSLSSTDVKELYDYHAIRDMHPATPNAVSLSQMPHILKKQATAMYFPMDGSSKDQSGNDFGTSDTNITYEAGKFGKAARFNGASSKITTSYYPLGQTLTISVWFNVSTAGTSWVENLVGCMGTLLRISYNDVQWWADITVNAATVAVPQKISSNAWHHVVVVQEYQTYTIYFDGSQIGTGTSINPTNWTNQGDDFLGQYNNLYWFDGLMDDVAIAMSAISSTDVTTLWNSGNGQPWTKINVPALKFYFPLNQTGTDVVDASTYGFNGTANRPDVFYQGWGRFGNNCFAGSSISNDSILLQNKNIYQPSGPFSVGCWFRTGTAGATQVLISSRNQSTSTGMVLWVDSANNLHFESIKNAGGVIGTNYGAAQTAGVNWCDNQWHLAIGVWNGYTLLLYVDGALRASYAWAYPPGYSATNYVRVSGQSDAGGGMTYGVNGMVDEPFLINGYALTAGEVSEMNGGQLPKALYHLSNLTDYGTTAYPLTAYGTPAFVGGYVSLNGSNQALYIKNDMGLSITSGLEWTMMGWVRLKSAPGGAFLFMQTVVGATRMFYRMYISSTAITVTNRVTLTKTINLNQWYHVAFTSNQFNENKLYLNGALAASNTANDTAGASTEPDVFCIGASYYIDGTVADFGPIDVDEVALWRRTLTSREIRKIYNAQKGEMN